MAIKSDLSGNRPKEPFYSGCGWNTSPWTLKNWSLWWRPAGQTGVVFLSSNQCFPIHGGGFELKKPSSCAPAKEYQSNKRKSESRTWDYSCANASQFISPVHDLLLDWKWSYFLLKARVFSPTDLSFILHVEKTWATHCGASCRPMCEPVGAKSSPCTQAHEFCACTRGKLSIPAGSGCLYLSFKKRETRRLWKNEVTVQKQSVCHSDSTFDQSLLSAPCTGLLTIWLNSYWVSNYCVEGAGVKEWGGPSVCPLHYVVCLPSSLSSFFACANLLESSRSEWSFVPMADTDSTCWIMLNQPKTRQQGSH